MYWAILLVSALFEAVWATALGKSDGFTLLVPTIVFGAGLVISMLGLATAMKQIPVSVAYSVWTGAGAALTVAYAMATGDEATSVLKVVFLGGIIACVIGLKVVKTPPGRNAQPEPDHSASQ